MTESPKSPDSARLRSLDRMFSEIAPGYDRGNRMISWGMDIHFRKVLLAWEPLHGIGVDLCAGTGDLADMMLTGKTPPREVILFDVSKKMLDLAEVRMRKRHPRGGWSLLRGDCEMLPFPTGSLDFVTCGFALRNMRDLERFSAEVHRILVPGGVALFVDAAHPESRLWGTLFHFYFYKLVPFLSRFLTRDHAAYKYLAHSLRVHRTQKELVALFTASGFASAEYRNVLGGVSACYQLRKASDK